MNSTTAMPGSLPNQKRRRRRLTEQTQTQNRQRQNNSENYCEDDDDKGHRRHEGRIFKGSCSFGQFVLNPCLCLIQTAISCSKRWHCQQKGKLGKMSGEMSGEITSKTYLLLILVTIVTLLLTVLGIQFPGLRPLVFSSSSSSSSRIGRPLTDDALNQIRITISKFNYDKHGRDLGGWRHVRPIFFHPTLPIPLHLEDPDFGGLEMSSTAKSEDNTKDKSNRNTNTNSKHAFDKTFSMNNELLAPPRIIDPNDDSLAYKYWENMIRHAPNKIQPWNMFPEDLEDRKDQCRPPAFVKRYHPYCNLVHELALGEDYDEERDRKPGYDHPYDSFYISYGAFRTVWLVQQPYPGNITSAIKMTRYKKNFNMDTYWNVLNDALVMEELTGSPRIVDIYSHCGGTIWVEGMPNEVEEIIIKQDTDGMMKPKDLPKELTPFNNYTVEEKLDLALSMAESLADLHGFRDGVIVHDDVQLCQWLKTADGRLKLGDFNRAWPMEYNEKKEKYCKYENGGVAGNYRAPEEYDEDYLNEQIDVFSFGNNIFGLLTGLWVFYDVDDDGVVQRKVIGGTRAYIDPRWKKRSYIESKLVEVMEKCWIPDVDKRIDIFGAVRELREIKKDYERRKAKNRVGEK